MTVRIPLTPELEGIRHYLHEHPERSFREFNTTTYLKKLLRDHGNIVIRDDPMKSGLVADIVGTKPVADIVEDGTAARDADTIPATEATLDRKTKAGHPVVGLRADIDGLPVTEPEHNNPVSLNEGVMHACGHDIHMASLVGAAFYLADHTDDFAGTVRLFFQPAEETGEGAKHMIAAGLTDGLDVMVGTHNNPNYKPDQVAVGVEPMMAGCIKFNVTLTGTGTHGGYPEKGRSPIEAMASMVLSLQTIVSRNETPFHPLVVSVTAVHGGDVWNVIPQEAGFQGTVRYFYPDDGRMAGARFRSIVTQTAAAYGIHADIDWEDLQEPVQSDAKLAEIIADDVPSYARIAPIRPSMAGEDFIEYSHRCPVVFAFIGSNGTANCADWHSPAFLGLDASVATGASFYANAALRLLEVLA
ncbi:M20 metallopeptidase family protein [Bifidobacterium choloepi]|uniref:Amidohydrolase n=1 Tax=Bifidobacterium choloepi TaxID=2614131 RepID=A0A6I5N119_9BIFI|nr:amidohydrolase [Bifidobacterium choloepi]NEG70156.1 amidohydrolase [Bifidobacterium choloepi]